MTTKDIFKRNSLREQRWVDCCRSSFLSFSFFSIERSVPWRTRSIDRKPPGVNPETSSGRDASQLENCPNTLRNARRAADGPSLPDKGWRKIRRRRSDSRSRWIFYSLPLARRNIVRWQLATTPISFSSNHPPFYLLCYLSPSSPPAPFSHS